MNNIPVFCGRNVPISELAAAIETALGLDAGIIPTFTATRASFVAVGVYQNNGLVFCNEDAGSIAAPARQLIDLLKALPDQPIKETATKI